MMVITCTLSLGIIGQKKGEIIVKTGKHSSGLDYLVGAQMLSHCGHSANS